MPESSDPERPAFTACPSKDRTEFCVLVNWSDRPQNLINHFATLADAQQRIERESENWLRSRRPDPGRERPTW
jgi:hypothetical protein